MQVLKDLYNGPFKRIVRECFEKEARAQGLREEDIYKFSDGPSSCKRGKAREVRSSSFVNDFLQRIGISFSVLQSVCDSGKEKSKISLEVARKIARKMGYDSLEKMLSSN